MRNYNRITTITYLILIFILTSTIAYAGTPHGVAGSVNYASGGAVTSATFRAYITSRSGEVLTQSSAGCQYYSSGYYLVQCGSFSTAWTSGDVLRIDFTDATYGTTTSTTVTLNNDGSQTKNVTMPDPPEPDISLSPSSNNYGSVDVGSTSSETFTVSNDGDDDLSVSSSSITGTDAGQFSITSGGGSVTLAPGESHNITVQFGPSSAGSKSASLSISSDDPDEGTKTAALSGTGVLEPDIGLSPSSANFGSVSVSGGSETESFTVSNSGNDNLNVSSSSISGSGSSHFSITSGGGSFSLAPGATHTIQVTYNPSSAGSHSASLNVSSDDPDEGTKSASLSGTGTEPDITLSPSSENYGDVVVDQSSSETFTVGNSGSETLSVSSVSLTGGNSDQFSITSGGGSFTLAPGATRNVTVQFSPTSEGAKSTTLRIASNDPDENPKDAALSGTGVVIPDIAVSPSSKNYGNVRVGSSSSQSFTVSNEGNGTLNVGGTSLTGTNSDQFSITSGGGSFSLAPGGSRTVAVAFNPTNTGAKSANLRFSSDDPDEGTKDVALSGTGTLPDIGLSPSSQNYGDVVVDQTGSETFTVSNDGDATLNVSSTTITGTNSDQFSITSGGGSFSLSPGSTRSVTVQFAPTSEGAKSANLSLSSDDPDENPKTAALSGTGIVIPDIAVSPSSKNYGNVELGATSSQTFTVSNTGNGDLSVSSVTITGSNADQFSITSGGGSFTLAPGGTRSVSVQFAPTSQGAKSGTLRLASDDPDENPKEAALSGTGTEPDIQTSTSSLALGDVVVGSNSTETLTVSNTGDATLSVTSTTITGGQSSDFAIVSGGGAFSLAPSGSRSVQIRFAPGATGSRTSTLRFVSNDPDENPKDVSLGGTGVVPDIAVNPTSHDYGSNGLNANVTYTFVVSNEGTSPLSVTSTTLTGTHSAEFSIVSGGGAYSLNAGATRNVTVRFTPVTTGDKTATMRISSNDPDEANTDVALSGRGILVADISLSPSSKNFGNVTLGQSVTQTFTISNSGSASLSVSSTSIVGTHANQFNINSGGGSFSLAPGASRNLVVEFEPDETGAKNATLRIASNDPNENPKDAALSGNALPVLVPDISLSPGSYDFGEILLGSVGTATIVVTNKGNANLGVTSVTFTGANADEFAISSGGEPFTLEPNDTHDVIVQFAPVIAGEKAAQLRFASNDPNENPKNASLTGVGVEPDIAVSPLSKNYGFVEADAESLQTFSVTNEGTALLSITNFNLTGDHPDQFAITAGGDALSLDPGETHQLIVAFRPLSAGAKHANLQILSDDPDENPLLVPLSGNDEAPDIAAVPAALGFGNVVTGDSASLNVVFVNEGTAPLEITSFVLNSNPRDAFLILDEETSIILNPGETDTVALQFKPDTLMSYEASLRVTSNDPDENPLDIPLSGTGVLRDETGPYLTRCYPPNGAASVPVNSSLQFRVYDDGYGVDRSTLNVRVNGTAIISSGQDQTGGLVTIQSHSPQYSIRYTPASNFDAGTTVTVQVTASDLAVPAHGLDSLYQFTTGASPVTQTTAQVMSESGGGVVDAATGVAMTFPEGSVQDSVEITIGLVSNPPVLPDTVTGIGWNYQFGPSGIQFQQPVTIAIPYTASDLANAGVNDPMNLPVYYFVTSIGEWVRLIVVDANEHFVFVEVTSFCYLVLGREPVHMSDVSRLNKTIPTEFALHQNYPNPFNPETQIVYELPQKSQVWIGIFDILGRQVRLLVNEEQPAGFYEAVWNGKNSAGQQLPSGVYFYRLETEKFTKTLKMMLIR